MDNKTKYLVIILLLSITALIFLTKRAGHEPLDKNYPLDSLEILYKMKIDSITRVNDSITAAKSAYENRPWKINKYIDDFGDKTKESYIRTAVEGKFSNTAVVNKFLYVVVIVDKKNVRFDLYEYSRDSPRTSIIGSANIKMKNSSGIILELHSIAGTQLSNYPNFEIYNYSKFTNFLQKSSGEIKVVIKTEYSSMYSFKLDATGFTKEFGLLKN